MHLGEISRLRERDDVGDADLIRIQRMVTLQDHLADPAAPAVAEA